MKFIHISDVHLGIRPDAGHEWSEKRARDIWDSFAGVIEVARRKKPDFLFVTGDLFHAQPLKKELKEVDALFRRIPETNIVMLAGNHDYLRPKSYYLTWSWPQNVYFFQREEAECFDFPGQKVSVYGLSYWHREIRERLYDTITPANKHRINILLVHGGDERHIPFQVSKILQNGFDYLAAGHIHKSGWLAKERAVMAGSLEPTDCNDTGPHGYWMGELEKGRSSVHFFPIRNCQYCHETYLVQGSTTERELYEWAKELLAERPSYQYFRLFLEGRRDPEMTFDLNRLRELERVVDVTERLMPDYDYERMQREHEGALLGSYIGALNSEEADAVTKKALEYGVNALLGNKICR